MVNKRKRDDFSDSDDIAPGKQILPVANLPDDFDLDPEDGAQYLFLVRYYLKDYGDLLSFTGLTGEMHVDYPTQREYVTHMRCQRSILRMHFLPNRLPISFHARSGGQRFNRIFAT
jgi:hypothetical protein